MPLARFAGKEQADLVGLVASEPPRRVARGRDGDALAIYLCVSGNSPLSPARRQQMLEQMTKTFYDTPGSVTNALRAAAESLNDFLLDRNVQSASAGRQGVGLFAALALRNNQLSLALSGPLHIFHIGANRVEYTFDPEGFGRGLGLTRAPAIRYSQLTLEAGDSLLIAAQPSPTWSERSMAGLHGQGPESVRRKLVGPAVLDLNAFLLQARAGKGRVQILRAGTLNGGEPAEAPHALPQDALAPEQKPAARRLFSPPRSVRPQSLEVGTAPATSSAVSLSNPQPAQPADVVSETSAAQVLTATPSAAPGLTQLNPIDSSLESPLIQEPPLPEPEIRPLPRRSPSFGPALRKIFHPFLVVLRWIGRALAALLMRILPGESFFTIPSSAMALIAIAVPVVIVATSVAVYLNRGLAAQSEALYAQAVEQARLAESLTDPLQRRAAWESVLNSMEELRSARSIKDTEKIQLRAQGALDEIDLVRRPNYQPAIIGGLPDTSQVTHMVVSNNDLYMLDSRSGEVIRALVTSRGYEIDNSFQCGPNVPPIQGMGSLVDLVAWPTNLQDVEAAVVALDASGNLLFCQPGKAPVSQSLTPPQSMPFANLQGLTMDLRNLYLHDPASNAVWVYWGSAFAEEPQFYFAEAVPPLQDVIDLAVDKEDLYLLHADGRLTLCTFYEVPVASTRCNDPTPYVDIRAGYESQPLVPPSPFTQIQYSQPPDPSLYLLEPKSRSIYHFSLRNLVFQRQFRPLNPLPGGVATAFVVDSTNRLIFLAIGSQIYYASLP